MLSTFYQTSNIAYSSARDFIETAITDFYNEIERHLAKTDRKFNKWHLIEYGEMTMVNFFINGIIKNDEHGFYAILNEFGIENPKNEQAGRADIIIEDYVRNDIYYIEAKKCWSSGNAPNSKNWEIEKTKSDYNKIIEQANRYFNVDFSNYDNEFRTHTFYTLALVFDSVRFNNTSELNQWKKYDPVENEFYSFKTFNHHDMIMGLACYGIVTKVSFPNDLSQ